MADPVLLLTVTTPARVIRVASEPIELIDADGGLLVYVAGLDSLTVSLVLSWLSSGGALSVPVQCVLPFDLAEDEAAGHHVAGCPAEVAVIDGDALDYSERRILALGTVTGPEYGEIDEPVSFSIEGAASESQVEIPVSTAQVDGVTMPTGVLTLATDDLGQVYPRVYGSPGRIDATHWVTGGQAVWVEHGGLYSLRLLVAGQWLTGSDYVWLSGDADVPGHRFRIWNTRDSRGQEVCIVAESVDWEPDDPLADSPSVGVILWDTDADGYFYGLGCDFQPNPADLNPNLPPELYQPITTESSSAVFFALRGPGASDGLAGYSPYAGDVCIDLLGESGAMVDYGRWQAASRLLAGYRFDFVIDARVKILAWLAANVYPLLPMSVENGPGGLYPVVWRYDATAEDATARIDADLDPGISRAGAIKETTDQIANAFSLQYRYSVRTGNYTETVTRDATTCPYCAASERRWGRIEQTLSTVIVYDAPTAAAVLAWRARAYTSPQKRIPYLVPSGYRLTRGQVVLLTDSRIHVSAQLCIVSDVQIDGTGVDGVEFLIVPDFPRDR